MGATFTNERGEEKPLVMGCYGVGVSRLAQVAVEQFYNKDGLLEFRMSKLIEGLKQIEVWLKINMPERASELRPGLSHDDIKEQINDLPFNLPEE